jgi:hypothetical protein
MAQIPDVIQAALIEGAATIAAMVGSRSANGGEAEQIAYNTFPVALSTLTKDIEARLKK